MDKPVPHQTIQVIRTCAVLYAIVLTAWWLLCCAPNAVDFFRNYFLESSTMPFAREIIWLMSVSLYGMLLLPVWRAWYMKQWACWVIGLLAILAPLTPLSMMPICRLSLLAFMLYALSGISEEWPHLQTGL